MNRNFNNKTYELSNHLGNVMVTVSDKRLGQDSDGNGMADFYLADVTSATDYYPFGMVQPGRSFSSQNYRFGFNGKEKDTEGMGGGGSTYDYGFRIYNPQLGKFLSVDPLTSTFPWYTPYQFAGNKPTIAIDLDGLEELFVIGNNSKPSFELYLTNSDEIVTSLLSKCGPGTFEKISFHMAIKNLSKGELLGSNGNVYQSTKYKVSSTEFKGEKIYYNRGVDKGNQYFSTKKIDQVAVQSNKGASKFFSRAGQAFGLLADLVDLAKAGLHADELGNLDVSEFNPVGDILNEYFAEIDNSIMKASMSIGPRSEKNLIDNSKSAQDFLYVNVNNETLGNVLNGSINNVDDLIGQSTNNANDNFVLLKRGEDDKFTVKAIYSTSKKTE